ncbi:MAG: DNA internalization-related competence protein ComEC/Rec2 [Desulfovibrionales bacterium]
MNAWKRNSPQSGPGSAGNGTLERIRGGTPVLLPWQYLVLSAALGVLALGFLLPALVSLTVLFLLLFLSGQRGPVLPALFLFFAAGMAWGWAHLPGKPVLPEWMAAREKATIEARISTVRSKPGKRVCILLDSVLLTDKGRASPLGGTIMWTWEDPDVWPAPGQIVRGSFRIKPVQGLRNFGTWNTEWYWRTKGVQYRTYTKGALQGVSLSSTDGSLRTGLRKILEPLAEKNQGGALVSAILMGERYWLGQDTISHLRRASLSHSLALSGMHLGFVVGIGFVLARLVGFLSPNLYLRVPRPKLGILMALPLAGAYLWLGQGVPSLMRAAVMFVFWGILLWAGRGRILVDGLAIALAVFLLFSPLLLFDLGLQFSILAVTGIALLWPLFASSVIRPVKNIRGGKVLTPVLSILGISLMANAALFPVMAWYFGQVSPHLYLNVVWLPLLGFVVLPLSMLGLFVSVLPGLADIGLLLLHGGAGVADGMLAGLTRIDSAGLLEPWTLLRPPWSLMLGYWLLIAGLLIAAGRARKKALPVLAASAVFLVFSGVQIWSAEHPKGFSMSMLDVGQGQSILLEFPGGKRILLDGGGSWSTSFDMGRAVVGPVLTWGRPPRVHGIILSHPHADHLRGLFHPLSTFDLDWYACAGDPAERADQSLLGQILAQRNITPEIWRKGQTYPVGNGFSLEVLSPGPDEFEGHLNNRSLVLRVVHKGEGLVLIPGDADKKALYQLLRSGKELTAQVLVLPHHGSKSSLVRSFYDRVDPDVALSSAGFLNHFFFPSREVVEEISRRKIPLLTTAEQGEIEITWSPPEWEPKIRTVRGEKKILNFK